MNDLSLVQLTTENGVSTILLARPDRGNALDLAMARALADAVEEVARTPSCRALVLRGEGRHFCVGGDAVAMAAAPDPRGWVSEVVEEAHRAIRALDSLQVVVVAAVRGAAAGAGLGLALVADLVVCTETSRFVTAYSGIGLTPDAGVSWLLPRAVGRHRAMAMLVAGTVVDGPTAHEWGLAHEVVAEDLVDGRATDLAAGIAARAHVALGRTRRLVTLGWSHDLDTHLDQESAEIVRSREASQPWLDAFIERHRD